MLWTWGWVIDITRDMDCYYTKIDFVVLFATSGATALGRVLRRRGDQPQDDEQEGLGGGQGEVQLHSCRRRGWRGEHFSIHIINRSILRYKINKWFSKSWSPPLCSHHRHGYLSMQHFVCLAGIRDACLACLAGATCLFLAPLGLWQPLPVSI